MALKDDIAKAFWWVKPTLAVFDFWKQIATGVAAIAFFVWTMIDHLPWSVIAAVVYTATTSTIFLLLLPALFRTAAGRSAPAATTTNLMIYKDTEQFTLNQAACLLAGVSPRMPYPSDEARDWANALAAAINEGRIKRVQSKNDDWRHVRDARYVADFRTTIARDELKRFADQHGRKPEFLYGS